MPAVIVKKEEKVASVFAAMSNPDDIQEFKTKFKEMYPKEWQHKAMKQLKTFLDEKHPELATEWSGKSVSDTFAS